MNSTTRLTKISRLTTLVLALIMMVVLLNGGVGAVNAQNGTDPNIGMVCTTSATNTFNLTTRTGYIQIPDGNAVYMWGFSEENAPFQHPSPVLCVKEGETVTVNLTNTLDEDVSIIFPGQENVQANGSLSQPVFTASGELVSLAPVAAANGGTATYSFVASLPGTFLYESGTEPSKQIDMGLFGALIVRPSMNVYDAQDNLVEAYAYNDADTRYKPTTETLMIMSDLDPELHMAVEQGYVYNMNQTVARYWMINGRSFPDTIADNFVPYLPDQPYGSLVYIHPFDPDETLEDGSLNPAYNPYPALIRTINVGRQNNAHHAHGNHGRVIGMDGHLLKSADGWDMSMEKFTLTIAPGQTLDSLFTWWDVENWDPTSNPIPILIPQLQDLTTGTFYSGSPYHGGEDGLPVGTQALNQCGEYYHIAHNHALHQITAWGMVLSGHITFARIDPPLPNMCQ